MLQARLVALADLRAHDALALLSPRGDSCTNDELLVSTLSSTP
jgi:hypothetical protein